ncbi:hypothetical protein SteCoe_11603 [Stentor coeruleus]|uniref:RING-type domain-containing protein n=1 Tax=Stentor coeruleus TaxID=5963 RepID=A0A1R2CCU4_9CILI|nr:hypothetical protein SteCoe_11603 [Stentor coeruleus]
MEMESQELNHIIAEFKNLFVSRKNQILSQEVLSSISALSTSVSISFDQNIYFTRIYKLLNCTLCQTKSGYFKLNCLHYICKNCFKTKIQPQFFETLKFPQAFECPTCQRFHSLEDFKIIFDKDWIDIENDMKSERIRLNHDFICFKCKNQKSSTYLAKGVCNQHKYCSECVGEMGRNQDWCNDITQEANNISENLQGFCTSCEKTAYYVGDFLTFICQEHLHCYDCLQKAQETGKCQTCCIRINNSDRDKINKVLYSKCSKCNSQFEKIFFVPKKCCKENVCALCQMGSAFKCVRCQQVLEKNAVELIQCFEAESARRGDSRE